MWRLEKQILIHSFRLKLDTSFHELLGVATFIIVFERIVTVYLKPAEVKFKEKSVQGTFLFYHIIQYYLIDNVLIEHVCFRDSQGQFYVHALVTRDLILNASMGRYYGKMLIPPNLSVLRTIAIKYTT